MSTFKFMLIIPVLTVLIAIAGVLYEMYRLHVKRKNAVKKQIA